MAGIIRFLKLVHIIKICKYFDKKVLRNPPHAHSAKRWAAILRQHVTLELLNFKYSNYYEKTPTFYVNRFLDFRFIFSD